MTEATTSLRKTPLNSHFAAEGAKLVEFGGWEMPLQFSRVLEEHHAVRKAAGLFDISHMGILSVHSPHIQTTLAALNALVPQNLGALYPGKAVYTQLLNANGGIIDDIIVYAISEIPAFPELQQFMVICNASNCPKVMAWFQQNFPPNVEVDYLNETYSLLALQGPQFKQILAACQLTPPEPLPKRFHIGSYLLSGIPVVLSRTGYTGEDGVEILVAAGQVETLWKDLMTAGSPLGLLPVGLAARDTLRLEAAYPLHGSELSESISPLEAGLGWSVKLNQTDDFIGKAVLEDQIAHGLRRHFVCFEVLQKAIPRHHDLLYDEAGTEIGVVTSGSISPTLDKPIGVGYVNTVQPLVPGSSLSVGIRGHKIKAVVVERPFYKQ